MKKVFTWTGGVVLYLICYSLMIVADGLLDKYTTMLVGGAIGHITVSVLMWQWMTDKIKDKHN